MSTVERMLEFSPQCMQGILLDPEVSLNVARCQ